jgi:hypothetical protein
VPVILKHVTDSLRRQDWIAVAIEFFLVLIGVLLAFQINQWASERVARVDRNAAAQRLLLEAEEAVAFFRLGVTAQGQLNEDLGYAIANAESRRWATADQERMTEGLMRALEMTTPGPPSSVYDDLVSSGAFGRIGDPRMRTAVARYNATLKFHRESIEYLRQSLPKLQEFDALEYTFDPAAGRTRLTVDFAKLGNDARLREELAVVANTQGIAMVLRKRNLKRAIEMCEEIGRVAGRRCRLDRPPPSFN